MSDLYRRLSLVARKFPKEKVVDWRVNGGGKGRKWCESQSIGTISLGVHIGWSKKWWWIGKEMV